MSSVNKDLDNYTDASRIMHSRISKQQKTMLQRLMDNHPSVGDTHKMWPEIATQLNQIPGARKNWMQWRKTWKDINKKTRTSHSQPLFDSDKFKEHESSKPEERLADAMGINGGATEQQLQLLQRTADQECTIVGSLVAVKLRSMQKEQKLIAEKLISEVLFQGQMEMFQYSNRAVNITGYFSLN